MKQFWKKNVFSEKFVYSWIEFKRSLIKIGTRKIEISKKKKKAIIADYFWKEKIWL